MYTLLYYVYRHKHIDTVFVVYVCFDLLIRLNRIRLRQIQALQYISQQNI